MSVAKGQKINRDCFKEHYMRLRGVIEFRIKVVETLLSMNLGSDYVECLESELEWLKSIKL